MQTSPRDEIKKLIADGSYLAAIGVCLEILSKNPNAHIERLLLAKAYYLNSNLPFAVQELETLCKAGPDNQALKRLLNALDPAAAAKVNNVKQDDLTLAEIEFD